MPKVPDATVAAVFAQRDQRRYSGGGSPWTPCQAPYVRVLIKVVAHKTKLLPPAAQALSGDDDGDMAEPEQFETTRALCTPTKVAQHLGCDVGDLIHLNDPRYGPLKPGSQLQQRTRLLQPYRSRTVQGLVVAHSGGGGSADGGENNNKRFRIASLDPDGVNMRGAGQHACPEVVDESVPENTCFEFEMTADELNELGAKVEDVSVYGPVRLEPVADRWFDDDPRTGDMVAVP
jgi:hypothetical protein